MKKRILIFTAAAASMMLCACSAKKPAETTAALASTEAAAETTTTAAGTSAEVTAEETDENGLTPSEVAEFESAFDELTYDSIDDLDKELGYAALTLPEYWGEPDMIALVDGQSCIAYVPEDLNNIIQVNSSPVEIKGTLVGDGVTEEEKTIDGVTVKVLSNADEKSYGAYWSDDSLNYSIEASAIEQDQFDTALTELVGITNSLPGGKPEN